MLGQLPAYTPVATEPVESLYWDYDNATGYHIFQAKVRMGTSVSSGEIGIAKIGTNAIYLQLQIRRIGILSQAIYSGMSSDYKAFIPPPYNLQDFTTTPFTASQSCADNSAIGHVISTAEIRDKSIKALQASASGTTDLSIDKSCSCLADLNNYLGMRTASETNADSKETFYAAVQCSPNIPACSTFAEKTRKTLWWGCKFTRTDPVPSSPASSNWTANCNKSNFSSDNPPSNGTLPVPSQPKGLYS